MQPISALEYGALGVLCLVLAGVGKIGRDWLKGNSERMDKQDGWMRELIASDRSERKEHIQAWQSMVERDIETRDVMNGALAAMCDVLEASTKEGKEERKALGLILENIAVEGRVQRGEILKLLVNKEGDITKKTALR